MVLLRCPFWKMFYQFGSKIALIDGRSNAVVRYDELHLEVERIQETLQGREKQLIFLPLENNLKSIVCYLGALASDHTVCPYGKHMTDEAISLFLKRFRPSVVAGRATSIYRCIDNEGLHKEDLSGFSFRQEKASSIPHKDLVLLLSTSGSTGSNKYVRLSQSALEVSARQVQLALGIKPLDIAITSLPSSYIYGLTVLHSHLAAGATVVIDDRFVLDREFWQSAKKHSVTSFSGVPWTYGLLQRSGFVADEFPHLTNYTTSGGKTPMPLRHWQETTLSRGNNRFFHMYGQTEACGRISVLPPEFAATKPGSVGKVVEGASISVGEDGLLHYRGHNVMMGYAADCDDLGRPDEQNQELDTEDFGTVDSEGFIYVTGRKKRITKVFGMRVNLDEIQAWLEDRGYLDVTAVESDNENVLLLHSPAVAAPVEKLAFELSSWLGLPNGAVTLRQVNEIHRSENGKPLLRS